jgi:hypothetical protein
VLHGAQPHHGQLLAGLGRVEGGVVGLHHQQLRPTGDGVAHHRVVGDLEADDVTDRGRADAQHPGAVPGDEVRADPVDLRADHPGQRPQRHVLGERDGVPLGVAVGGAAAGQPDHAGVADPVGAGGALAVQQHGADEDGCADGVGGGGDALPGVRVAERVDVGGVLRPHDQVGAGSGAGADPGRQVEVAATWFSSTARRWALKSSRGGAHCPARRRR